MGATAAKPSQFELLRRLLSSVNGATFISIDTLTKVELLGGRENPFLNRVQKQTTASNVIVFQNKTTNGYENMVQRRLIDEGKDPTLFDLSPRPWGNRIPNTPFVFHKDCYYLEVIFLRRGAVEYLVDGHTFPKSAIPGIPVEHAAEQGGLSRKVILRDFKVDSITGIMINHEYHSLRRY